MPLEKKQMKGRNTREQRFDKRKDFSAAKENSKTKNAVLCISGAAKEVHANNKTD